MAKKKKPASRAAHTCGDSGGINKQGTPCQRKTSTGLCPHHREEPCDPGGRPPLTLTQDQVHQVERLASVLNQTQLAYFLGMSPRTFRQRLQEDDQLFAAYKRGESSALATVGSSLIRKALSGNTTAQIFYLKTRGGWRETDRLEVGEPGAFDDEGVRELPDEILVQRALALAKKMMVGPNGGGNGKSGDLQVPDNIKARMGGNGKRGNGSNPR